MRRPLHSLSLSADAVAGNLRAVRQASADVAIVADLSSWATATSALAAAASAGGIDSLIVATLDDAIAVRNAGVGSVLAAWHRPTDDPRSYLDHTVVPVVSSVAGLEEAARAGLHHVQLAAALGSGVRGFSSRDLAVTLAEAAGLESRGDLRVDGLWGFPGADVPAAVTAIGSEFETVVTAATRAGLAPPLTGRLGGVSAGSTAIVIDRELVGVPFGDGATLASALRVTATVVATKTVDAGEGISYGYTYRTSQRSNLALVSIGYVHGLDRVAGNRGVAWLDGVLYPIAGRVAMDVIVLDLGSATTRIGAEVVIVGDPARGEPGIATWAAAVGRTPVDTATAFAIGLCRDRVDLDRRQLNPEGAEGVVTIDLDAYRRNLTLLRDRLAPSELMAVIKGDAYGHGLLPIARAAVAAGVTRIGVLDVTTGLTLRSAGIGHEVSLFAWLLGPWDDYRSAIDARIELGVSTIDQLEAIGTSGASVPARLHLKIDTGLHRNGATEQEWPPLVAAALELERAGLAQLTGVWTHIAEASDDEDTAAAERFRIAIAVAEDLGAHVSVTHLAASAAGFARDDCRFDLVRMGAFTYGIAPGGGVGPADLGLAPVMTLAGTLTAVRASNTGRTGVVSLGTAHGIPAGCPGLLPVTIDGRRYPIVGRVEARHLEIDLGSDDGSAEEGDRVVIFGGAEGELTLQDWADTLGTIGEELAVRVSPELPRRYLG
ncbi:MAG: alanine racemase [Burkholderiaceae bacterium]|nr:alanine racemase [Microbacteriaceae bacterium]